MSSYTFGRWIMEGNGWTTSYQAQATLSLSRAYGSDYAVLTASNIKMYTYGGDSSATWTFYVKVGSTWYDYQLSSGGHTAGVWYSYSNKTWNIPVGATSGSLTILAQFKARDYNNSIDAWSARMPSTSGESYSYGSKGASTISSATNVTLNTSGTASTTVKFTSYSSSFRYRISANCNGTTTQSGLITGQNSAEISAGLAFPTTFISAINSAKSATCTLTLTTYSDSSGSTSIGTSTKNITLTVPSGINPSVSISTAKVSALSSTYFSGKYCTLIDKMQITLSTSTQYSATISSKSISANGQTFTDVSPATTNALTTVGVNTVSAKVTDSRGNSATNTATVNVYQYFYPTVTVKYRHTSSAYYLDFTGRIASVGGDNSGGTLMLSIYDGTGATASNIDLSSYIATTASGGTYDGYYNISGTYEIPHTSPTDYIPNIDTETYRFVATITDAVTSTTSTAYSGIPVMTFGAGGTDVTVHKKIYYEQPQYWIYAGKLIQGISTTTAGYGRATIFYSDGVYRVDFSAQITTYDSTSGNFDWGIDRDLFISTIGKSIRFVHGGNWLAVDNNGYVDKTDMGYGTLMSPRYDNRFACFGRMYATDGSGDNGLWPSSTFGAGCILQGVAYATD